MRTKNYLLISMISLLFYQCMEEDTIQLESNHSPVLEQKLGPDSRIELDSILIADSIEDEADPPKDKDPYIKRNEEGGE